MTGWVLDRTFRTASGDEARWAALGAGQDVSLGAQARVFTELLAHWEPAGTGTGPAVVAHDFGGCVALRAHLLGTHREVFGQLPPELHRALVREYVSSASHAGLPPAVLDRLVEPWCTDEGQPAFYRQIGQNDQRFTDEIQERYGELALPALICWGTRDTWIPPARGRELAARIPGSRLRLIDGAGHLVQEDAPAELTAALGEFLGEDGGSGPAAATGQGGG
ncbi:alpha/beta hydrolase [Streptomyces sp. NBC_01456]|uniref:alpha/beta fold hydrolase n=1 Tax=unclassified Streptomyces TaxID=2593676 RepID=UPI002E33A1F6|nr:MULTISPECIES: alpha/beta hydrolase [unclassified Streptomyces]